MRKNHVFTKSSCEQVGELFAWYNTANVTPSFRSELPLYLLRFFRHNQPTRTNQAHIQMQAAGDTNEGDISGGGGGTYRFRCEAYSSPSSSQIRPSCLSATAAAVSTTKPTAARNHHPTSPTAAVEAAAASGAGEGEVRSGLESRELPALLFAFELEVHAAAQWAGAAAAGASVRVWARLTDDVSSGGGSGGSRAIFQRIWEHLQQDALRQNRRWRREALRAGGRGRAAGAARGGGNVEGSG